MASVPSSPSQAASGSTTASAAATEFASAMALPVYLGPIEQQINTGTRSMEAAHDFFQSLFKAHSSFAHEIEKLVQNERTRIMSNPDNMALASSAWLAIVEGTAELATAHAELARKGRGRIVQPLKNFYNVQDDKSKAVKNDSKQAMQSVSVLKNELEKLKAKSLKAAEIVTGEQQTAGIKSLVKSALKKETLEEKVSSSMDIIEAYNDNINNANTFLRTFYSRELPLLLNKYQSIEEQRLEEEKKRFDKYLEILKEVADTYSNGTKSVEHAIQHMNTKRDIQGFVSLCSMNIETSNIPPEYQFDLFKWDLPITLEELRRQARATTGDKTRFMSDNDFECDLKIVMQRQAEKYPKLEIPVVFIRLWDQVKQNGGFEAEGIFRLAPDSEKLVAYQHAVVHGNYEVPEHDPHLPAALLKKWLRDLPDPLIPSQLYKTCVKMSTGQCPAKLAFEDVLNQLPELNRKVMMYLIVNLTSLCNPTRVQQTKMGMSNLGIVFGPCILRCESDDPTFIMMNAKNETKFAEFLVQVFMQEDLSSFNYKDPDSKLTEDEIKQLSTSHKWARSLSIQEVRTSNKSRAAKILMDPLMSEIDDNDSMSIFAPVLVEDKEDEFEESMTAPRVQHGAASNAVAPPAALQKSMGSRNLSPLTRSLPAMPVSSPDKQISRNYSSNVHEIMSSLDEEAEIVEPARLSTSEKESLPAPSTTEDITTEITEGRSSVPEPELPSADYSAVVDPDTTELDIPPPPPEDPDAEELPNSEQPPKEEEKKNIVSPSSGHGLVARVSSGQDWDAMLDSVASERHQTMAMNRAAKTAAPATATPNAAPRGMPGFALPGMANPAFSVPLKSSNLSTPAPNRSPRNSSEDIKSPKFELEIRKERVTQVYDQAPAPASPTSDSSGSPSAGGAASGSSSSSTLSGQIKKPIPPPRVPPRSAKPQPSSSPQSEN